MVEWFWRLAGLYFLVRTGWIVTARGRTPAGRCLRAVLVLAPLALMAWLVSQTGPEPWRTGFLAALLLAYLGTLAFDDLMEQKRRAPGAEQCNGAILTADAGFRSGWWRASGAAAAVGVASLIVGLRERLGAALFLGFLFLCVGAAMAAVGLLAWLHRRSERRRPLV